MAIYWPATHYELINFDDQQYITDNFHVRTGLTWSNISWAFRSGYASNWHPLTWVSHMADVQVFGLKPGWPHLTNAILHATNSVLLFLLLQQLSTRIWRSAVIAGLFALHPLHVESVAWVAERKDVLSGFFFFLTVMAYVRYVRSRGLVRGVEGRESIVDGEAKRNEKGAHRVSHSRIVGFYILALLLFALGLMSKPMLVTLPFVLLLLDYWPLKRFQIERWRSQLSGPLLIEKLPFLALSITSSIITVAVQHHGGAVSTLEGLPFSTRCANAILAYGAYLRKMFWPSKLCIFYPHPGFQSDLVSGGVLWKVVGIAAVLMLLTAGSILFSKKAPYITTGWLWFLGMLVPVIGLLQAGSQGLADRYTYLPLIGLFICIVWVAANLLDHQRIVGGVLAVTVLASCGILTHRQLSFWRNNFTVFSHALEVAPSAPAYYNVGVELGKAGKLELAEEHFRKALETDAHYADAAYSLGYLLMQQGKNEAAAEEYRAALRLKPSHFLAHNNLGVILWRAGKAEEAAQEYREAITINPDFAEGHENLAIVLAAKGELEAAEAQFREALRLQPNIPRTMSHLAEVLIREGKLNDAEAVMAAALRIEPKNSNLHLHLGEVFWLERKTGEAKREYEEACNIRPDSAEAQFKLGDALLHLGQGQPAETHLVEATRLRPNFADAIVGLGRSLAIQGKMQEAASRFEEALRLTPTNSEAHLDLGNALLMSGNTNDALAQFERAATLDPTLAKRALEEGRNLAARGQLEAAAGRIAAAAYLNPKDAEPHRQLGTLFASENKFAEAEAEFSKAAGLQPMAETFHDLALAQLLQNKSKEAVANYRKAAELKPDWPVALNDLAWILATDPDPAVRNGHEAVRLAERACDISQRKEARYLGTLDAAYAEAGRFQEAIATASKARDLALAAGEEALAKAAEARLQSYKQGLPFRSK